MSESSISRRSFLKSTAVTAAAATVAGTPFNEAFAATSPALSAGPGNKWPGRVVINFNKDAVDMSESPTTKPDTVIKMIDDSIKLLTGETTIGAAWKSVFPSTLTAQSKIAIKVPLGCAAQLIAPHWASVKAIIAGLLQIDIGGAKLAASNITVYDMRCSNKFTAFGYTNENLGDGVNIVFDSEGSGYTDGANNKQYAKSLHNADFLINVFRAGGHSSFAEGLSLGFKNHYGTYPVNHESTAKTYLRDINCTGVVFKKNVLSVCVGIFGAKEASGSPGSSAISYTNYVKTMDSSIGTETYPPCTIIMSTDPVTSEMQTIKMMRLNNSPAKDYSATAMPQYLKGAAGISGGVTPLSNVGIIDESKMDIRKIINGQVISTGNKNGQNANGFLKGNMHVKQLHSVQSTYVEFNLPPEYVGEKASIDIYSINGVLLSKTATSISGINNHFSWDEKDNSGRHVGNGTYLITVTSGSVKLSSKVSIIR